MHHILLIADIQRMTCDEIAPPPVTRDAVQDARLALSTFSQTCRAWTEPALDKLQESLDSVEHLLVCLPHNLWSVVEITG